MLRAKGRAAKSTGQMEASNSKEFFEFAQQLKRMGRLTKLRTYWRRINYVMHRTHGGTYQEQTSIERSPTMFFTRPFWGSGVTIYGRYSLNVWEIQESQYLINGGCGVRLYYSISLMSDKAKEVPAFPGLGAFSTKTICDLLFADGNTFFSILRVWDASEA